MCAHVGQSRQFHVELGRAVTKLTCFVNHYARFPFDKGLVTRYKKTYCDFTSSNNILNIMIVYIYVFALRTIRLTFYSSNCILIVIIYVDKPIGYLKLHVFCEVCYLNNKGCNNTRFKHHVLV